MHRYTENRDLGSPVTIIIWFKKK